MLSSSQLLPAAAIVAAMLVAGPFMGSAASAVTINVPRDEPTIQAAINVAANGDEVVVAPGTYFETINFLGKAITVRSLDGAAVTTIDGGGVVFHVVQCVSGEGPDTVLDGFTITGGNANGSFPDSNGGGMFVSGSSPTVVDCTFLKNSAASQGGGVRILANGRPTLQRCRFIGNVAQLGGGLLIHDGSVTLIDCAFVNNVATVAIAGMGGFFSDLSLTRCVFADNVGSVQIGGLDAAFGTLSLVDCAFVGNDGGFIAGGILDGPNDSTLIVNCLFSGNSSVFGAGLTTATNDLVVVNCTFVENSIEGFYSDGSVTVSASITNCIFWDNGGSQIGGPGPPPSVTYSDIQGSGFGPGNIDQDPLFASGPVGSWTAAAVFDEASHQTTLTDANASYGPGELVGEVITPVTLAGATFQTVVAANSATTITVYGDWPFVFEGAMYRIDGFRLLPSSPCIDAGDNTALPEDITTDLDGNPRFVDDPATTDTGNPGAPGPIVDMGAYEFQLQLQDSDNDGIPDDEDACPDSDLSETVVIDGCDSGVANLLFEDGCTMADLIAECAEGAVNHGQFVSCVVLLTIEWRNAGLINGQGMGSIESCAAIPGDLDGDGAVGVADLVILLGAWGPCRAHPDACPADLDLDDIVGISDLLILLGNWG